MVLVADLGTGELREVPLGDGMLRDRVGGALLNLGLLRAHRDGDPVVLGAGPLTGMLVPLASSVALTARSPLTGGVVHCSIGDHAGVELRYAGFDAVVIRGVAERPCYLWLHDEQADLVPAQDLWGKDTFAITDEIRRRAGDPRVQVLAAGPACAAGSLAGSLAVNYWASTDRAAVGALLGAKRLLAVVVRGMGEIEPHDVGSLGPASLRLMGIARARLAERAQGWHRGRLDAAMHGVAPLVHSRVGAFFGLSEGSPYLMLDDDPRRRERSAREAPGVLVPDMLPLADLAAAGLDGPSMGRITRLSHRLGLDPARAARAVRDAHAPSEAAAGEVLQALAGGEGAPPRGTSMVGWELGDPTGAHEAFLGLGAFTPANPPAGPYEGVDGAEAMALQQGLAYVLGLDPAGAMASGLGAADLAEVVEAATGLDLDAAALDALSRRLVRETLAERGPAAGGLPGPAAELGGRFRCPGGPRRSCGRGGAPRTRGPGGRSHWRHWDGSMSRSPATRPP